MIAQLHNFEGERLTAAQIAERIDMPVELIRSRLSRGKRGDALREPALTNSQAAKRSQYGKSHIKPDRDGLNRKLGLICVALSDLEDNKDGRDPSWVAAQRHALQQDFERISTLLQQQRQP